MLIALVTLNLLAAVIYLGLAYGCWRLRQRLLQIQAQLVSWEQHLRVGLPTMTLGLTQSRYGMVRAQQQYALWQRRRQQLMQLLLLMRQLRWVWRRF